MADSLISMLSRLEERIKSLNLQISELQVSNETLKAENEDLRRKAEESQKALDRAELDAQYLAVSYKLADSPDNLIKARRHISQLIRNIDRCIEMLKEE